MKTLKRWIIVVVVLVVLGGLLELGLRVLVPSVIEGGSRVALRLSQDDNVTVETRGSMLFNALRWRIADVTVTADDVSLSDDVSARTTLNIGSMPLFPTFGKLRDGTATFVIPAENLNGMAQLVSGGLADSGEIRDGKLYAAGVLTDSQFDLSYSSEFEIPYESAIDISVDDGDLLVTPSDISVADSGPIGSFITESMAQPRSVCIADRLPAGVTLTGFEIDASGAIHLRAALSEGLLSNPDERSRGNCEEVVEQ